MSSSGGGWQSSMGTVGGVTRTFGLQKRYDKAEDQYQPRRISREQFARIWGYFRPYLRDWVVILLCTGAIAGLNVLPPFCIGLILDRALPRADVTLLVLLTAAVVALALVSGLLGVYQQSLTARAGQGIIFDLRNQLYQHLQRMSLRFYTVTRSGEIVSRINNDVNAVQDVASGVIVAIASNLFSLAAATTAMCWMNWRLTLLAVLVVPAFYFPTRIVGGLRRRISMQTQESQASLLAFLNEHMNISGMLLTNIFGQRQADAGHFRGNSAAVRDLNIRQTVVGRWLYMSLSVFSAVGPALIYWYGGLQVMRQGLTIGNLVAFVALLVMLYRPLVQLASVYGDIQSAAAVFDRIFAYLDMAPDVKNKPQALAPPAVAGDIVLEGVSFSYPKAAALPAPPSLTPEPSEALEAHAAPDLAAAQPRLALQDVSFAIASGQRVALVGPSGAGKTTVTYLVPRFYDPDAGRITLDGNDLRDLDQDALRSHIGMVTQETYLFHDTIRANLLYAKPGAAEGEMIEACRAANIHDFIAALPQGYDTVVGERGFRLSGGEKQRVSIARALLKNPAILILDEATSNLDATSEFLIQAALEKLLRGRTSLIIAHRLSTILSADKIVVLEKGSVAESGSHQELIEKGGLYARLFEQQFGKALELDAGVHSSQRSARK